MKSCKFCGITEETTHINRDRMCARCYRITEKAKQNVLTPEESEWFEEMCRFNIQHGMFVPVAQRRRLRAEYPQQWSCKRCGTTRTANQDSSYVNYCVACADDIRRGRRMPADRKTRSDKGGKHYAPLRQAGSGGGVTRPDGRLGRRS